MFNDVDEVVRKLGDAIIPAIKMFRNAQKEQPTQDETISFSESDLERHNEYHERMYSIQNGANVNLHRDEYWNEIIRAQIMMIGALGGVGLMRKVFYYLESHSENKDYRIARRFEASADGICGWYN